MTLMHITLNYLGPSLSADQIDDLLGAPSASSQPLVTLIEKFFGLPLETLPREIMERYCETSSSELYAPVMPYTSKLFERLISPLKSAKRSYCLGEYLATIELSAHVGEMLSQLTWKMTPVTHNYKRMTDELEKQIFGSSFERLGQERRLKILRAFGAISKRQFEYFVKLKNERRIYFHLWSSGTEDVKENSLVSYKSALTLVREILQVDINAQEAGKVTVNPLLVKYLKNLGEWKEDT